MSRCTLVFLMVILTACALRAEQVLVTGVAGQVLFGAGAAPWQVVKAGQHFGAGTFSVGGNGILYLSTFEGSELRLAESGALQYDGTEDLCPMEHPPAARSTFHLLKGKLEVNIKVPTRPPHCYRITLPHAQASVARGQCVMCMHGGGTFVYVARGETMISGEGKPGLIPEVEVAPIYGALPGANEDPTTGPLLADRTQIVVGSGQVAMIGLDGKLGIQPLSALTASTQTCLLAGFNPDVGAGGKNGFSPDASVVSPTQ